MPLNASARASSLQPAPLAHSLFCDKSPRSTAARAADLLIVNIPTAATLNRDSTPRSETSH